MEGYLYVTQINSTIFRVGRCKKLEPQMKRDDRRGHNFVFGSLTENVELKEKLIHEQLKNYKRIAYGKKCYERGYAEILKLIIQIENDLRIESKK